MQEASRHSKEASRHSKRREEKRREEKRREEKRREEKRREEKRRRVILGGFWERLWEGSRRVPGELWEGSGVQGGPWVTWRVPWGPGGSRVPGGSRGLQGAVFSSLMLVLAFQF